MKRAFVYIVLATLVDGCAGMTGALVPERWLARRRAAWVGFATGVLLGVTFLHVLPEAVATHSVQGVLRATLASFTCMTALEWWLGHRGTRRSYRAILPVMLLASDGLHNTSDGAAVAAAFLVSPRLGLLTTLAVVAHEVPKEIGDFALLTAAGMGRIRAIVALAIVQLTAGIGALAAVLLVSFWSSAEGLVLGIAAGTFLYIAATDLLPELLHESQGGRAGHQAILAFLVGLAIALVMARLPA